MLLILPIEVHFLKSKLIIMRYDNTPSSFASSINNFCAKGPIMKKALSIIGIVFTSFVFLLIISALLLGYLVDPNKFKGKISQYIYAKTGQVLVINGNMHWSLFPWMGLKAENLTYYNAPSFTPKIFVSAKEMDIKVKLIPLITGQVEIGNITLNNAVLNLIKNKSGQYNWQMLSHGQRKKDSSKEENHTSSTIANMSITSLKIKNSKLNWHDQQKNSHVAINRLNIDSKSIQFGQPFPLILDFDVINKDNKELSLNIHSNITITPNYKQFRLQDLKLRGEYFSKNNKIDFKVFGEIDTDLQQETLLSSLNYSFENINGQMSIKGTQITKKPHLVGTLSVDDFNLKNLLEQFNNPLDTQKADALKLVSLLTKLDITDSAIELTQLHGKIDGTDIYGNINVSLNNKTCRFNLAANQVNIDDYLSNKNSTKANSSNTKSNKNSGSSVPSKWAINGNIKVSNFAADKIKLSNLSANLDWRNNLIQVNPIQASLYQGNLQGSVLINKQNTNKMAIRIKQTLTDIDIKQLLEEVSNSGKLSGKTNLTADLVSTTDDKTSFLAGLNGSLQLALKDGALKGVDVIYQLSRAHAFLKHLSKPSVTDSKETQFSSLTATAIVKNGVINTEDLSLTSEYLKVAGKGSTNLLTKELSYHLSALAQPKLAHENNEIGKEVTIYQIPIKVSGNLSKPSVNLDFAELAKILYQKEISKALPQNLGKNINNLKDNLKDKVKEKIKNISPGNLLNKLTGSDDSKNASNENLEDL